MTIGEPGREGIRVPLTRLLDVFQVGTTRVYGGVTSEQYLGAVHWKERGIKMETKHGLGLAFRRRLKDIYKGVFERFGFSNFQSWEVAQICEICNRNGWVEPTHQVVEANSLYVFNPFAGGFLTSRHTRDQTGFNGGERFDPNRKQGQLHRMRYWNEPNFKALDLLRPVITLHSITEIEAALRWLTYHSELRKEFGDAVVVGASSTKKHLEENLEALDKGPLPADVLEALDAGGEHTRALPLEYWH
ncbi:NADP-dependent oxidoreductase domain-containing protein [Mycena leptocephala]|nr:NADP-dependent oxidoreductase domain-containing protein [Mycena leptocephala]